MGRHAAVLVLVALLAAACGDDSSTTGIESPHTAPGATAGDSERCAGADSPEPELLEVGVISELHDHGNDHVFCPTYDQRPPASGDHFGVWQNCGFYPSPVQDRTAVHALEHGAVWIAYQPDLTADEVAAIEARVAASGHVLAAPYPGLKNPIVLTAWTRQLAVDRVADPLFDEFIDQYEARRSPTAPEAGASCTGGVGAPPDPDADFAAILEQIQGG